MRRFATSLNFVLVFCNVILLSSIVYLWYSYGNDFTRVVKVVQDITPTVSFVEDYGLHIEDDVDVLIQDQYIIIDQESITTPTRGLDDPVQTFRSDTVLATVNLSVPFTSQSPEKNWNQPWQDACEEAVILMLDAYYKGYNLSPLFSKDEMQKMVDWETENGLKYSISITDIEKVAQWYMGDSFSFTIVEYPTIENIKQSIRDGNPVLVVAYGKTLRNPHFREGGPEYHTLIIRGYTDNEFITNDPGTQFGENFLYTYDNLMDSIHDWNGGDVVHGRSVVLIVDR